MQKKKNPNKISFKEKMIMKTFNPIVEKLLITCYHLQLNRFYYDDYDIFQKAVLESLKIEKGE